LQYIAINAVMHHRDFVPEPFREGGCLPVHEGNTGIDDFKMQPVVSEI
jgi:hypothetical protein